MSQTLSNQRTGTQTAVLSKTREMRNQVSEKVQIFIIIRPFIYIAIILQSDNHVIMFTGGTGNGFLKREDDRSGRGTERRGSQGQALLFLRLHHSKG